MRKIPALSIILVLLMCPVALSSEPDFREVRWGMSKEEVMKTEDSKLIKDEQERLGYVTEILDEETLLIYYFDDNKLVRSKYALLKEYTNKSDKYYHSFLPLMDSLTSKYGKPSSHDKRWKSKTYKDNPSQIGMAIATGGYEEYAIWTTGSTYIVAYINGNNFEVQAGVEYESRELAKLQKEKQKKKELKKL